MSSRPVLCLVGLKKCKLAFVKDSGLFAFDRDNKMSFPAKWGSLKWILWRDDVLDTQRAYQDYNSQ